MEIKGIGLHTGKEVNLELSTKNTEGIVFVRKDLNNKKIVSSINTALPSSNTTIIERNNIKILTIEHLLAACYALDINNLQICLNNEEVPILDGSSIEYVNMLNNIRSKKLCFKRKRLKKVVFKKEENKLLIALPDNELRITYFLSHKNKLIGSQLFSIKITKKDFIEEIAPARTFATYSEAIILRKKGLIKGGSFNNAVVFSKNRIFTKLRFPDECVRHKILDIIGNLCLLNFRLNAHIIGIMSGHRLNIELLKEIVRKRLVY